MALRIALEAGFMVEVDIRIINGLMYLGHDVPEYPMDLSLLTNPNCIFHAKDLDALKTLLDHNVHCFWHQEDQVTLTSQGLIWCYPGTQIESPRAIHLDFNGRLDLTNAWGICTDHPYHYSK